MKPDFLKGYTVVLNAHYIPGPLAAWFLKNLGARVIKIEPPGGDLMRGVPPFFNGAKGRIGSFFRALNAGFESIAVNLKDPGGVEVLETLLKTADVCIDGNRPGFLEKLTGRSAREINPHLVFAPITAFGLTGPSVQMAGHDGNCLSLAGALSFNGDTRGGPPAMMGTQAADITSGLIAAATILAMLVGRKNPASELRPSVFDGSMLDAAMFLNQIYVSKFSADGRAMMPGKEWLNGGRGYYRSYLTKDGRGLFFGAIEDKLFLNFAQRVGRPDLVEMRKTTESDPEPLCRELERLFATKTLAEWRSALDGCDCCCSPVNTLAEAMDDPQVVHRRMVSTFEDPAWGPMKQTVFPGAFDGQPVELPEEAPGIGEQTGSLLRELGFTDARVQDLFDRGSVR